MSTRASSLSARPGPVDGRLLLVATDRISAFDCILPNAIPRKGEVLTQLSSFWFEKFDFLPNQIVAVHCEDFPAVLRPFDAQLRGRSMLVKKAQPLRSVASMCSSITLVLVAKCRSLT